MWSIEAGNIGIKKCGELPSLLTIRDRQGARAKYIWNAPEPLFIIAACCYQRRDSAAEFIQLSLGPSLHQPTSGPARQAGKFEREHL